MSGDGQSIGTSPNNRNIERPCILKMTWRIHDYRTRARRELPDNNPVAGDISARAALGDSGEPAQDGQALGLQASNSHQLVSGVRSVGRIITTAKIECNSSGVLGDPARRGSFAGRCGASLGVRRASPGRSVDGLGCRLGRLGRLDKVLRFGAPLARGGEQPDHVLVLSLGKIPVMGADRVERLGRYQADNVAG